MDTLTLGAGKVGLPAALHAMDWEVGIAPTGPPNLQPNQIERLLAGQGGWCDAAEAPFKVTGPLGSHSFSRIFRGDGGIFPGPVAIKQFLSDPSGASPAESARSYFHGLRQVGQITAQPDLRAAEPYALLESHGIVVSSWIEGPTLARSLFEGSAARTRALIRAAGMWLAHLHHASGVERRSPDVADMLARLEAEITKKPDATGELTRRALALLRAGAPLLATQPVPWSRHHGDFKPANLIVHEDRLVGIDLELVSDLPTARDAAHFLNHLQLKFYLPQNMARWRESPKLTKLFCQGYSDAANEPLPHRLLQWQRLYNATYLMTQHREWSRSPMAWPVHLALRHLVWTLCNPLAD
ncbi:phosphotransferase family protein [Rhodopila sp.]|uniref:phosphotransferase family protein n=1 Tax=Rhodopila sp. TaxID=2480087 RepID=UPI003D0E45A0